MENNEKILKWYESQINMDKKDLDREKKQIIQEVKKVKKNELFEKPKLSLWQRVKKVLMGI